MITCDYATCEDGPCGPSIDNSADTKCVLLRDCQRDIQGHKKHLNIKGKSLNTELELLLARAGLFEDGRLYHCLTVCPRHRDLHGIRFRSHKKYCAVPSEWAPHKSANPVGDTAVTFLQSKELKRLTSHFIPVGLPICRRCRDRLKLETAPASTTTTKGYSTDLEATPCAAGPASTSERASPVRLDKAPSSPSPAHSSEEDESQEIRSGESSESLTDAVAQLSLVEEDASFLPSDTTSTGSTASSGEVKLQTQALRRTKLNEFLKVCGHPEAKGRPKKTWQDMGKNAQWRHTARASNAIVSVLEVMTPDDAGSLWQAVQSFKKVEQALGIRSSAADAKYLQALSETYANANSWDTKQQALAVMVDLVSLSEMRLYIPQLNEYRYKAVKMHLLKYGRGAPVPAERRPRVRIDEKRLDAFLSFITSPHVIQDLPIGQKYIRLSNGDLLETPNVIRSMIPARICAQYTQFCKENDITPLSESTVRRLLTACSATVRKSLQGLDYISADGAKAFDDLVEVVRNLEGVGNCDHTWTSTCERALKQAKQYLKSDYKVHISDTSNVADHCAAYALSEPNEPVFAANPCDHQHDMCCSSCGDLGSVLSTIGAAVDASKGILPVGKHDDVTYTYRTSTTAIQAWKAHQLRSIQQDKPRLSLLSDIAPHQVLIVQDWAMKFLPQKYRETQADWFGKRGISWHISVAIRRSSSGTLEHQAFVHIAENCTQDSISVVSIMEHTLRTIKAGNPDVNTAFYRQDNAGCYHSAAMITACRFMESRTGIKVERVDFSDPQGGKGACDRKAATIKGHVRRYIAEGNDVNTAADLRNAILSHGGVSGVRVALVDARAMKTLKEAKIDGISKLHNFRLSDEGVTMWRAYAIGVGRTLTWSQLQVPATISITSFDSHFSPGNFIAIKSRASKSPGAAKPVDEPPEDDGNDEDTASTLFSCPVAGCIKSYQRFASLEEHMQFGKCAIVEERISLIDKAAVLYRDRILQGQATQPILQPPSLSLCETSLLRGWALKTTRKAARFSEKQKSFLDELFEQGQETGHKLDPPTAAEAMRAAKDLAGNRRFQVDEFLSASQVQSYFSRKAAKLKKSTGQADTNDTESAEDAEAADDQEVYSTMRAQIVEECQLRHPILYDSINSPKLCL